MYHPILVKVLKACPRGLPLKSLLKITVDKLETKHSIQSEWSKKRFPRLADWLDYVTDIWCVACRHVRDLAKSRTKYGKSLLMQLIHMISLGEEGETQQVDKPQRKLQKQLNI